MDLLNPEIQRYVEEHTQAESAILRQLNRETHAKVLMPKMLSGHLQGRVLSMFSRMIQPSYVLEIGTYTGYSAICLAEGLTQGGKVITLDVNEELEPLVRRYFEEAGVSNRIDFRIGDALEIIPKLNQKMDLVFIDADKKNYADYFDLVIAKVRKGGYILADNVLWSGKVIQGTENVDKDTQAIQAFNDKVHNDQRVENVLFPIRDGLMVMRKL